MKLLVNLIITLCVAMSVSATTIHVPADQPTIQAAINAASNGDTVLVSPGIYHENLDLLERNIVLCSRYLTTKDTTFINSSIIDGSGVANVVKINGGQDSTSKIAGFTIRHGIGGSAAGGGIYCGANSQTVVEHNIVEDNQDGGLCAWRANPRIQYNVIRNNTSAGPGAVEGGGIYCFQVTATIRNNLIVGNTATVGGGVFYYYSSCDIQNNTIVNNAAHNWGGGIAFSYNINMPCPGVIRNNIVWGNFSDQIVRACDVRYCDVQGDSSGNGNLSVDPQFVNLATGDYRLQSTSPCVDAGDPDPAYNDPDGSRNDMGAFPLHGGPEPPVLSPIGAKSVAEGEQLTFRINAHDPNLTIPTLTIENSPVGSLFVDSGNGAGSFSWTPSYQQAGSYDVLFIASDGTLADSELVIITVTNVIRPPEITALTIDGLAQHQNLTSHQPLFLWQYVDPELLPQTRFEIGVGSDSDWVYSEDWNPAPSTSPDTFVTYNGSPLVDGQSCYLRLRVFNGPLWSNWFETTFRMNSLPSTPVQIRPIANSVATTNTPTLWVHNATDAEGDLLTYEFNGFHDTDCVAGPPITLTGIASGTDSTGGQIITSLSENCRYWWMARAYDGHEYGPWSPWSIFYVNGTPEPPIAFALKSPVDSGLWPEFNMLPTCIWNQTYDPDPFDTILYKLELSDRANFSFAYVKDSLNQPQFTLTDSLYFGTRYYWRVTAQDRTGLKMMAPVRDFWTWKPGDADHSHTVDISDLMSAVDFLVSSIPITPLFVGDFNGDCTVDISDVMYMVDFLTGSGPAAKAECNPPLRIGEGAGERSK